MELGVQRRSAPQRGLIIGIFAVGALAAITLGVLGAFALRWLDGERVATPAPPPSPPPAATTSARKPLPTEWPKASPQTARAKESQALIAGRRALEAAEKAADRYRAASAQARADRARTVTALSLWVWASERAGSAAELMARAAADQARRTRLVRSAQNVAAESAAFAALSTIARRFNGEADMRAVDEALDRLDRAKSTDPEKRARAAAQAEAAESRAFSRARAQWLSTRRDLDYVRQAVARFTRLRAQSERSARIEAARFSQMAEEARSRISQQ